MSHFEKSYSKASLVILALTFSGCSGGFTPSAAVDSTSSSGSSLASSTTGSLSGLINSSSIIAAIGSAFQIMNSLSSDFNLGTCSGSTGPSSQTMTANYPGSSFNVTSSTLLTYSAGNCDPLRSNQITLAPTVNVTDTTGDTVNVTSAATPNYLGVSVGGGAQVNYDVTGLTGSVNILGLNSVTTGSVATNISIYSTSPFAAALSLTAPYFSLTNDGAIVVDDNTDQMSLALAGSGLVWAGTCGCPVGGSLNGNVTGLVSGTVTVSFSATCGSISLTALGNTTTVSVPQCQL